MKLLKEAGVDEVRALRSRVIKSLAMGRIGRDDHDYLVDRLDEVEARIVSMEERDPRRKEF